MQSGLTVACMFCGLPRVRAFECCSFVPSSLTVATTVSVRVPMSMTASYELAPRHSKNMHYHTRPLHAAVELPLPLESSDDSSYVPYEPHTHTPSADAYSAQGAPQQRAPSSLGSRMVAPVDAGPFNYFTSASPTMPVTSPQRQQHQRIQQHICPCSPPTCIGQHSSISKRAEHEISGSRPRENSHNMSSNWAYDSEILGSRPGGDTCKVRHSDMRHLASEYDILRVRTSQQQQQQQQQRKRQEWCTQRTHKQTHDQRSCSYRCDHQYHMQQQKGGGIQPVPGASACQQRASYDGVRRPEKGGSIQQRRPMLPPFNAVDFACMHTSEHHSNRVA